MPEIIDANAHIISEPIIDEIARLHDTQQAASLRNATRMYDVDARIDFLDRHGIDRQVVNLVRPTIWSGLTPAEAIDATRLANDEIRRIADEHPDRLIPMGTVPFLTDEYLDEIERCVEELEFPALQIFSNIDGTMLDDQAFEPFWETVDALRVPIWIHPQLTDWHDFEDGETWLYKMLGWPFDTSMALARLVFSGVLDRHRHVEVVSHHLGGTLPYLVGRFQSWYQTRQEEPDLYAEQAVADLSEPIEGYLDRIYGDTAVSSQGESYPLECGLSFFGVDNVVYGSDYPLGPDNGEYWPKTIMTAIDELAITDAERERIYSGNVARLLDG